MEYNSDEAAAIEKYGAIGGWCVSGVTDMGWLFSGFRNFNADISGWDTSRVTDMSSMFQVRCSPRSPPPILPSHTISTLHAPCTPLCLPPPRPAARPRTVCPACDPRQRAYAFNQPQLNWDTSGVTNMNHMFVVRCTPPRPPDLAQS